MQSNTWLCHVLRSVLVLLIVFLRQGRYRFDRIRPIINELRGSKSADALQAALTERRTNLTHRARAMLDGAALLQQHITEFIASDAPARANQ